MCSCFTIKQSARHSIRPVWEYAIPIAGISALSRKHSYYGSILSIQDGHGPVVNPTRPTKSPKKNGVVEIVY